MDYMDSVDFAYERFLAAEKWGRADPSMNPQGVARVHMDDTLPFIKVAVIRRYLDEYGNDSLD